MPAALFNNSPVHNQLDYQILRYVISASFPLGGFWLYCFLDKGLREGYWALSIRIKNILLSTLQASDSRGRQQPQSSKFPNTFNALACTYFSHSSSVCYSHCLSKLWFQVTLLIIKSANSLILFVSLWWLATQPGISAGLFWRNEDAHGARVDFTLLRLNHWMLQSIAHQTVLFSAVAIFRATYAAHYGCLFFVQIYLSAILDHLKGTFWIIIHRLFHALLKSLKLHLMPHLQARASTDMNTCCLHSSLSTCILSTSFRLSWSRWLFCLSSRM